MAVIRTVFLGTSQPSEGIIAHPPLSERIVQSEPQPVSLVHYVSLCHFLDKLLHQFGCIFFLQLGVQILPTHRDDFGILRRKPRKGFRNRIFFADLSLDISKRKIGERWDLEPLR